MLTLPAMATDTTAPPRVTYRPTRPNPIELILAGFADVWSRRRLTHYLVQADLAKQGANTLLGNIWWVLDPLLQMLVYVVFISVILRAGTPDYPLFVFCAILPWKWFASTVNGATGSVVARERIIKQVKFPKIVLPVSTSLGGIVHFAFGLIPLFALLLLLYLDRLTAMVLLIPVVAAVQFAFTIGVAIMLSAVNVFYRDISNLTGHVLRLWFYLSPALYS